MDSSVERILYASLEDVSLPYGPGVNERGFLKDMLTRADHQQLRAVIPRPSRGMPKDLKDLDATFLPAWGSVRSPFGWAQARALGSPALLKAINSFRPDLIVMRVGALSIPLYLVARRRSVPYVLKTAGDGTFRRFYERNAIARALRGFNRRIFDEIMQGAACIDVASQTQRDVLKRLYPDSAPRIHVIDNGVDLQFFRGADGGAARERLGFGPDEIVIGYVGNWPMRRGGKEVVDAIAGLMPTAGVRGLVVGDSGEVEDCRRYARGRGVAELVVVYGEADYGEVPELMAAIEIGLSILRPRERNHAELKVRQYLASESCVVGTAGSNDFLHGRDFARVVDTTDPDEIVQAIAGLVRLGRGRLSTLGQDARIFAESTLSLASRNNQRIKLWEEACERSYV